MSFDLATAKPVTGGFDLSTAMPVSDNGLGPVAVSADKKVLPTPGEGEKVGAYTFRGASAGADPADRRNWYLDETTKPGSPAGLQRPWTAYGTPKPEDPALLRMAKVVGGAGEAGLNLLTGVAAAPMARLTQGGVALLNAGGVPSAQTPTEAMDATRERFTYAPRTVAGKGLAALPGEAVGSLVGGAKDLASMATPDSVKAKLAAANASSPVLRKAVDIGKTALGTAADLAPLVGLAGGAAAAQAVNPATAAATDAEAVLSRMRGPQSMGAAAAAPPIESLTPELKQSISQAAKQTGGAVNPTALTRHVEAGSLPVPLTGDAALTEGQALGDPAQISIEKNMRGVHTEVADRFNAQNQALKDNVEAIREQVAPQAPGADPVAHGDTLIQAYQDKAAAADADVAAKYKALRDANQGNFPVDARQLMTNVQKRLDEEGLLDHAPSPIMRTLGKYADDNAMSFKNFEAMRTNLARIQRNFATDGNEKFAAGLIRDEMEKLPLAPGTAELKPLADTARAASRAQFQALEADPAYKAAVNETVKPGDFVNRFVIRNAQADPEQLKIMAGNLAHDPEATQTLAAATIDHLRNAARLTPTYEGNFAADSYNRALTNISPGLRVLVGPQAEETLGTLGRVARYTTEQPKGSFVSNSGTTPSLLSAAASRGADLAEGVANRIPYIGSALKVGSMVRGGVDNLTSKAAMRAALAPGAGLANLPGASSAVQAMLKAAAAKAAEESSPYLAKQALKNATHRGAAPVGTAGGRQQ